MSESFLPKQATLLSEIRNWKKTESLCKGVYDEAALKSRSFLQLKMQTYQGLYKKYKGTDLSLDEKALHRMLRYHYKKIEKTLYPNLLVRFGRRTLRSFASRVRDMVKGNGVPVAGFEQMESVIVRSGSVKRDFQDTQEIAREKNQENDRSRQSEGWWVNDLGGKNKEFEKEQGMGMH